MKNKHSTVPLFLFLLIAVGAGCWYGGMWFVQHNASSASNATDNQPEMQMGGHNMQGMSHGSMTKGDTSGMSMQNDVEGHATVMLASAKARRLGITVDKVVEAPLHMSVRTVGIVKPDETRVAEVFLKTEGWVNEVFVDFTGKRIEKGAPLLSIYSPDFVIAQQELLVAEQPVRSTRLAPIESNLATIAREKLQLLDIPEDEIRRIESAGKPSKYLTLRSPQSGTVMMKHAFAGQRVTPSQMLYEVADLSHVWVQAKVYEYELPHVELNQPVTVRFGAFPDEEFTGKVIFVQPSLDESTRTTDVRIELPNKDGRLKIGMFADVEIMHDMGSGLLVPTTAVIRTGDENIVYRMRNNSHYEPLAVEISPIKYGDKFQVLSGLAKGDQVVASANFLFDSESRLRAGNGGSMPGMEGMDMSDMEMGSGTK